ncbi:MAG: hypothetical protein ACE5E7_11510 [Anaerolineae bacterium]
MMSTKRVSYPAAIMLFVVVLVVVMSASLAHAVTNDVGIGGEIYSGTGTVSYTMSPLGEPIVHRNANYKEDGALPLTAAEEARVMIQDMETGDVVAYGALGTEFDAFGTVISGPANSWTAVVPAGGEYIAMFSARDHDLTSRVFDLTDDVYIQGSAITATLDAYLPALYMNLDTGVIDPVNEPIQPLGNLLVFAFEEKAVNGAPDGIESGLPGVLFELYDPLNPTVVYTGTSLANNADPIAIETRDGLVIPGSGAAGHYYFEGIPPGEYRLRATPGDIDAAGDPWNDGWYHTYTMEGGQEWEILIYPGDPGTEAGAFMAWFGFVKKLGQLPAPPPGETRSSISGTVEDADVAWEAPIPGEPPEAGAPLDPIYRNQGVSPHVIVPDAFLVLWEQIGDASRPIASVDADPVTGVFTITNVPAGTYNIFLSDKPLYWIFGEMEITVDGINDYVIPPFANEMPGMPLAIMPRFAARVNGFVVDESTGIGIGGATVNLRYQPGNAAYSVTTEPNGWYNFEWLPEIETMAMIDVEPPPGYRGKLVTDTYWPTSYVPPDPNCDPNQFDNCPIVPDPCNPATDPNCVIPGDPIDVERNGMNRWVQYYTAQYKSDLILEPIPTGVGHIQGIVYNDSLDLGTWVGDGLYDKVSEGVIEGVTIELRNGLGDVITTTSGTYDMATAVAQGYIPPGQSVPPDEWGGFFSGPMPGFYEFRDVAPGRYTLTIIPPFGFSTKNGFNTFPIEVGNGARVDFDIGLHTLVPQAGQLEGGIFDDQILDTRWYSAFSEEKALLVGYGVTVRDYLGYQLDLLVQPSGLCYAGTTPYDPNEPQVPYGAICDRPDLGYSVEIDRLVAPGLHLYWGNDPALPECTGPLGIPALTDPPCFNPNKFNLELPYTMNQGLAKYEADWSLGPALGAEGGGQNAVAMFVTDLDAVISDNGQKWLTTVTVTMEDEIGPLPGAEVFGSWSNGEAMSCQTNIDGQCSIASAEIDSGISEITFTVNNVVSAEGSPRQYGKDGFPNSDSDAQPEGPNNTTSDGTVITVVHAAGQQNNPTMHVSDLDGIVTTLMEAVPPKWNAEVTISVVDDNGAAVDGAVVYGTWDPGETTSCTTGDTSPGQCKVISDLIGNSITISFTVNNIQKAEPVITYDAISNTDPDGNGEDSDGTTITLSGTTDTNSQAQNVEGEAEFAFLGTNGVAINPGTQLPLGLTTVEIIDPVGGSCAEGGPVTVSRCFTISPANNTGRDATLRFFFNDANLNGLACADLRVWHYDGNGAWSLAGEGGGTPMCNPNGTSYVEVTGVTDFSDFALAAADNGPTAVSLMSTSASAADNAETALMVTLIVLALLTFGSVIHHGRKWSRSLM